jgi:predicted butyrate kinase (DUF1464 family)
MVKAIGIDPGTKSMDLFGFDDETDEILTDMPIPRDEITNNPGIVLDEINKIEKKCGKIDAIVGPSGYGIPLTKASNATESQIMEATFLTRKDLERRLKIVGLRELMFSMKKAKDLNIWFTPGVIHLPTVPEYRKINRIDIGTADKVFSAVLGIHEQAEVHGIGYPETSFILLEIGFGYTAAIAVENGKIIDGIGGTSGALGYMGMGAMDGELAYALANTKEFSKLDLFNGGAVSVSGIDPFTTTLEEFVNSGRGEIAYDAFLNAVIQDTHSLLLSVKEPREILLSGRFTGIDAFVSDVKQRLEDIGINAGIRNLRGNAKNVKEAAEGAAIIANGIAGGRYSGLTENMELKKSSGSIFDHIYLERQVINEIRERFSNE